jgi:hypothetical protein
MRMVGEGEPGFPDCLLLLPINKRLEKVYRYTPEYAYYLKNKQIPLPYGSTCFNLLWIIGL